MSPVLSYIQAKEILAKQGSDSCTTSLDLGLTQSSVQILQEGAKLQSGATISWEKLKKLSKSNRKCIGYRNDEWFDIRVLSETTGWVRALCPTLGAPTTLVSGFPMHRIKNTDPWEDTKAKLSAIGRVKGRVLDTATGLGYTAIQASSMCSEVVTVEIDPAAIEIAKENPWSHKLFTSANIQQIIGDIEETILSMAPHSFAAIIHDPPTIQYAGELYSESFYKELRRVLKPNGVLFHYVADPKSRQGQKLTDGVMSRLRTAGFKSTKGFPEAFGVVAKGIA